MRRSIQNQNSNSLSAPTSGAEVPSVELPRVKSMLTRELARQFELLHLSSHVPSRSTDYGSRRAVRPGESMEFMDYREYSMGDDLRYLDWKAYGRLDRLYIKEFSAETNLSVHVLVDTSASMYQSIDRVKAKFAVTFAHGLASAFTTKYHAVRLSTFSDTASVPIVIRSSGRKSGSLRRVFETMEFRGRTSFARSISRYAANIRPGDIVVLISDFFDPEYERALRTIRARRSDLMCVHMLSDEELRPAMTGSMTLLDVETSQSVEVDDQFIADYASNLKEFQNQVKDATTHLGGQYAFADCNFGMQNFLRSEFRSGQIIRCSRH